MRFGANSPRTSVTNVSRMVTRTIADGRAAAPRDSSGPTSGSASETAATADARKPARVIPTWTVAKSGWDHGPSAPTCDRFGCGQPAGNLAFSQGYQGNLAASKQGIDEHQSTDQSQPGQDFSHLDHPSWGGCAFSRYHSRPQHHLLASGTLTSAPAKATKTSNSASESGWSSASGLGTPEQRPHPSAVDMVGAGDISLSENMLKKRTGPRVATIRWFNARTEITSQP